MYHFDKSRSSFLYWHSYLFQRKDQSPHCLIFDPPGYLRYYFVKLFEKLVLSSDWLIIWEGIDSKNCHWCLNYVYVNTYYVFIDCFEISYLMVVFFCIITKIPLIALWYFGMPLNNFCSNSFSFRLRQDYNINLFTYSLDMTCTDVQYKFS